MNTAPDNNPANASRPHGLVSVAGMYGAMGVAFVTGAVRLRLSIGAIGEELTNQIASTFLLGTLAMALAAPQAGDVVFVTGSRRRFFGYFGLTALVGSVLWGVSLIVRWLFPQALAGLGLNADPLCWVGAPVNTVAFITIGMLLSRDGRNLTRGLLESFAFLFTVACMAGVYLAPPEADWSRHRVTWEALGLAGLLPLALFVLIDHKRLFGSPKPLDRSGLAASTWLMRLGRLGGFAFRPLLNLVFLPAGMATTVMVLSQFRQGGSYASTLVKAPMFVFGERVGRRPGAWLRLAVAGAMTGMLVVYVAIGGLFDVLSGGLLLKAIPIFAFYLFWTGIDMDRMRLLLAGRVGGLGRCTALATAAMLAPIGPAALVSPKWRLMTYLLGVVLSVGLAWWANRATMDRKADDIQ